MDLKDYCDNMKNNLTTWKAKTYDLIRESDKVSPENKKRIEPSIEKLNEIVENIDKEIARLEKECPVEWEAEKEAMKIKFKELEEQSGEIWRDLSPDDY